MASGIPFSQDVFFGPNTIHAMVTAFDKACRSLTTPGSQASPGRLSRSASSTWPGKAIPIQTISAKRP